MEVSKTSQRTATIFLILAVLLVVVSAYTAQRNLSIPQHDPVFAPPPTAPTAQVSISHNVTDHSIQSGTQLNFTVTIANSPPLKGFNVYVSFDPNVLTASNTAIDSNGNILQSVTSSTITESECITGQPAPGGACTNGGLDGPGVVNLGIVFQGNFSTPNNTNGLLYHLALTVNAPVSGQIDPGATQIHIVKVELANSTQGAIPYTTSDAFFTNRYCSGQNLCTPPVVNMTYTPPLPSIGTNVTFSAVGSHATNSSVAIGLYQWSWGSEICHAVAGVQVFYPPSSTVYHVFCNARDYDVTLLVNDTLGIKWEVTRVVTVQYVWVDVTYNGIGVDRQFNVLPGTVVHISASVVNNSTLAAPATLTIRLDTGLILANQPFNLTARGTPLGTSGKVGPVSWDTTGYPVRAYRINVVVNSPVPQNLTRDKQASTFVQLIYPQPSGGLLSFSLLESSGVSILVIVALVAGLSRFRRKPSWETEPIVQE